MSLAPPLLTGRYVLDEPIGAGGYCQVWRATDTVLTRPVAVKLLHAGYAQQGEALARFKAEARHAGALSHENIARVYDYGEPVDGQSYLVMELVDGPSLAGVLAGGPLSAKRTMDVVAQVAAGLQAAHAAGLIHRDIKPANILFAPGGCVRITDFGIAHVVGSAPVTSTGMVMGTPGYIAPEQIAGARAGPASDLYALGVVAYECLAGAPPFSGGALEVAIAHRDRPLPPLPASVPAEVAGFVMMLTAKDPAWRPGSAGDVAYQASRLRDELESEMGTVRAPGAAGAPLTAPDDPRSPALAAAPPWQRTGGPQTRGPQMGGPQTGGPQTRGPQTRGPQTRGPQMGGPLRRRPVTVAALALAALTCFVLLSVTGFASGSHPSDPPSPAGSRAAPAVTRLPTSPSTPPPTPPTASQPASRPSPARPNATNDNPSPPQNTPSGPAAQPGPGPHHHKKGHGKGNGNSQ